jgi:hypothetical protein
MVGAEDKIAWVSSGRKGFAGQRMNGNVKNTGRRFVCPNRVAGLIWLEPL